MVFVIYLLLHFDHLNYFTFSIVKAKSLPLGLTEKNPISGADKDEESSEFDSDASDDLSDGDSDDDDDSDDDSDDGDDAKSDDAKADGDDDEDPLIAALKKSKEKKERNAPPDIKFRGGDLMDLSFHPIDNIIVSSHIDGKRRLLINVDFSSYFNVHRTCDFS